MSAVPAECLYDTAERRDSLIWPQPPSVEPGAPLPALQLMGFLECPR